MPTDGIAVCELDNAEGSSADGSKRNDEVAQFSKFRGGNDATIEGQYRDFDECKCPDIERIDGVFQLGIMLVCRR